MSCLASDNKKWITILRKCVDCPHCPLGKARNFSEHYFGPSVPEGDTRCLSCRECPEGSFAGENGCQMCNIVCDTDFKRESDEICEESHDAECGNCLPGYEDIYINTMLPCLMKEHPTVHTLIRNYDEPSDWVEHGLVINNVSQTDYSGKNYSYFGLIVQTSTPVILSQFVTNNSDVDLSVQSWNEVNSVCGILLIFCVCILLAVTVLIICFKVVQRRPRIGNIEASETVNDIQTDGGDSQYISQTEVGGEVRLGGTVPLPALRFTTPL